MQSKKKLNRRWRFFCEIMLTHGFFTAVRLSGYQKKNCLYALVNDNRLREYMLGLIGFTFDEIKLTLKDLVEELHEMSKDDAIADKTRIDLKKDLIGMLKDANPDAVDKLTGTVPKQLKPAIEEAVFTTESKTEKTENKNGEESKNSTSKKDEIPSVQGETNNGSSTGHVPKGTGQPQGAVSS